MVSYLYEILCRYYDRLCNVGYVKQEEVDKILILCAIQKLVDCDFRGLVEEGDYATINNALYKLYGTSCLIPYPDYYNDKTKKIMYNCSISELVHRVERLESEGVGVGPGLEIEDKPIIVPGEEVETVEDLDL